MKKTWRAIKALTASSVLFALLLSITCAAYAAVPRISTSGSHSVAVKADNTLYAWGANLHGQVRSAAGDVFSPEYNMGAVLSASAGGSHTAVITTDGTLYVRGGNNYGQVGDSSRLDRTAPVKIMENAAAVSAGGNHTLALCKDGSVWAWGNNTNGQIGDGGKSDVLTPKKIMDGAAAVSAGYSHSAVIKTDGTLWVWGANSYGQIGDSTTMDKLTPVQVLSDVKLVSAGGAHTLAVKNDDTLWAWGSNAYGQIGNGARGANQTSPVQVMSDVKTAAAGSTMVSLAGTGINPVPSNSSDESKFALMALLMQNGGHSLAVKNDGTLWAWGSNTYGQIGDDSRTDRTMPVKIMDGVTEVSAGSNTSAALTEAGDMYMWGSNNYGQLGKNDRLEQLTPLKILSGVLTSAGTGTGETPDAPETPAAPAAEAKPSRDTVMLNGNSVVFDAYKINGSNYYKLRDIAYALRNISETTKRFSLEYHEAERAVALTRGGLYSAVGGEMSPGRGESAKIAPSTHSVYLDGKQLNISGYNIDGNNYFKVRDIMQVLDIYVGYDDVTKLITLDTSRGYAG